jgi:hypothetical protein
LHNLVRVCYSLASCQLKIKAISLSILLIDLYLQGGAKKKQHPSVLAIAYSKLNIYAVILRVGRGDNLTSNPGIWLKILTNEKFIAFLRKKIKKINLTKLMLLIIASYNEKSVVKLQFN